MSDILTQKCDGCGAVNTTNAQTWTRVFGVTIGKSLQPIQVMQPRLAAQSDPRKRLDFCPDCASTVTVDKLPALLLAKK